MREAPPDLFETTRMFEPDSNREVMAETLREALQDREYSPHSSIRKVAHFEGQLTPQALGAALMPSIPEWGEAQMRRLGYRMMEFGRFNWERFVEALVAYRNHHGDLDVPRDYVIDESLVAMGTFPSSLEEFPLGDAVMSVRCGDVDGYEDPVRRKQLDNLGFHWGDLSKHQRYRFAPMFLGLKIYKHLYGFALVQYNYVVPDDGVWPIWMIGMPLGKWATIVRVQQQLVQAHYPHRWEILNSLEFMWWMPPGPIEEKYFQPLQ